MSDLITTFSTLQQHRQSSGARRVPRVVGVADVPTDLITALREMELLAPGDVPRMTTLASGRTARVYRVDLGWGTVCLKRALSHDPLGAERTRAETGWFKVASEAVPGTAPTVLGSHPAGAVFAMEYLDADEFPSWQGRIAAGTVEPGVAAELGHVVGRLHAASANSVAVREQFASQAAFRALCLAPQLEQVARVQPGCEPRLAALEQMPGTTHIALVHGALSPDNVLLGPRGPVLIDADCAHSGDPMFDVAACLAALAVRMAAHRRLRAALATAYDAFHRSYFAHVTWEMPEAAAARAAALVPALLLAGLAATPAAGGDAQRPAVEAARALLLEPPHRLDDLGRAWLDALTRS